MLEGELSGMQPQGAKEAGAYGSRGYRSRGLERTVLEGKLSGGGRGGGKEWDSLSNSNNPTLTRWGTRHLHIHFSYTLTNSLKSSVKILIFQ